MPGRNRRGRSRRNGLGCGGGQGRFRSTDRCGFRSGREGGAYGVVPQVGGRGCRFGCGWGCRCGCGWGCRFGFGCGCRCGSGWGCRCGCGCCGGWAGSRRGRRRLLYLAQLFAQNRQLALQPVQPAVAAEIDEPGGDKGVRQYQQYDDAEIAHCSSCKEAQTITETRVCATGRKYSGAGCALVAFFPRLSRKWAGEAGRRAGL